MSAKDERPMDDERSHIVIGGGIAGVSCAIALSREFGVKDVVLVSASDVLKVVRNVSATSKLIETFDVVEENRKSFERSHPGIVVIQGVVDRIDENKQCVYVVDGKGSRRMLRYQKLCVCSGASPLRVHPLCVTIRDTDSVKDLGMTLKDKVKCVAIVGNGAIAMELVQSLRGSNLDIVWCIRDDFICNTMLDVNASMFFMKKLDRVIRSEDSKEEDLDAFVKRTIIKEDEEKEDEENPLGSGVGPSWRNIFSNILDSNTKKDTCTIRLETRVSVENIVISSDDKRIVKLSNGHEHECDLVISAIGVRPNTKLFQDLNVRGCSSHFFILRHSSNKKNITVTHTMIKVTRKSTLQHTGTILRSRRC